MSSQLEIKLRQAREDRLQADQRYLETIGLAKQAGWSNSEIARAVGLTEAAVRLYWQRHHRPLVSTKAAS